MSNQFPSPEEFEEFLRKFSQPGGQSGFVPDGMDPASFNAILDSIRSAFTESSSAGERPIDWHVAKRTANRVLANREAVEVGSNLEAEIVEAERIARGWIGGATTFIAKDLGLEVLRRAQWVDYGISNLRPIATPIAEQSSRDALANFQQLLPGVNEVLFGKMHDRLSSVAANLHGGQLGNFLALLADGVVLGSELTISPSRSTTYVAEGVADFLKSTNTPALDALIYIATRELLTVGLLQHNPWIVESISTQVSKYASNISFNSGGMEDLQQALEAGDFESVTGVIGALVSVTPSPEQLEAQAAIRHLLSLLTGWVDDRARVACRHLQSLAAVDEAYRRRRATSSPLSRVMKLLLNVELAESSIRTAAVTWQELYARMDLSSIDRLWIHPDLMPTPAELADPNLLILRLSANHEDDLDAGLKRLLEGPQLD